MPTIADSTAFRDDNRLLVQHQAALTLLQGFLGDPSLQTLRWLDLACGRGQIIAALDQNLSQEARSRIAYFAYDVQQKFVREVERTAGRLGLRGVSTKIGDLEDFGRIVDPANRFDFITLTNTVHEVGPATLSSLLLDCLGRLTESGCLFIYDMESLDPLELGAIPWTRGEFAEVLQDLFTALGVNYHPEVGQWQHKSCNGWNVQVHRKYMNLSDEEFLVRREGARQAVCARIQKVLEGKFSACQKSLESLTLYGSETADEQDLKLRLLYSFWSLSRALGGLK